ncbi:SMC-Scp complex subunit ScpB [candidate division KSB1 bacterium]|nr:SMC-Scp complex subunit ScpB [candidate division KSB1 bacterium]
MEYLFKKQIVEALIFASDSPISESRLIELVEELEAVTVKKIIDELNADYHDQHRAFLIKRLAGGYQLITRPEFAPWIRQFFRGKAKTRLSQAALEVLAIIAFKQPISRPQIEAIRGAQGDGVIKNLLERNLVTIFGRSDAVGHPLLYKTTDEFLRYFGINQLADLPKPKEINELVSEQGEVLESLPLLSSQLGQRDLFAEMDLDRETTQNEPESNDAIE